MQVQVYGRSVEVWDVKTSAVSSKSVGEMMGMGMGIGTGAKTKDNDKGIGNAKLSH